MPPQADKRRRAQFKRGLAKSLRADATGPERKLWSLLRAKQLGPWRFRRQQTIGPYVVDFFCPSGKLIIELDGDQHGSDTALAYDAVRDAFLSTRGYRVLRFSNTDMLRNAPQVIESILQALAVSGPLPDPPPLRAAGSTLPQGEGE